MCPASPKPLIGLDYLRAIVALARQSRRLAPTAGVWEAADFEWWWRTPRSTDHEPQLFWFDGGDPVAGAVLTDWGSRVGLDIITLPGASPDFVADVFDSGLRNAERLALSSIEVMVDNTDDDLIDHLTRSGFAKLPGSGTSAWMTAANRPRGLVPPAGYRVASRLEFTDRPHHFVGRVGVDVERRLTQTSMYRADLDLVVVDEHGDIVADALFWNDPVTHVGFVEPLGVAAEHRRRGLARVLLTEGLDRLVSAGATRLKINFENDTPASAHLYSDIGFEPALTTSIYSFELSR